MSTPVFSSWMDAIADGVKRAAANAREAAQLARDPNVQPPSKNFRINGVEAYHDMLAETKASSAAVKLAVEKPDATEGVVYESFTSALEAGALDMPGYAAAPSGPEEIAARYAAFRTARGEGSEDE